MSTYTELKGLKVKFLDSDPSPGADGDVWYNSVSGQLKAFVSRVAFHKGCNKFAVMHGRIFYTL